MWCSISTKSVCVSLDHKSGEYWQIFVNTCNGNAANAAFGGSRVQNVFKVQVVIFSKYKLVKRELIYGVVQQTFDVIHGLNEMMYTKVQTTSYKPTQ